MASIFQMRVSHVTLLKPHRKSKYFKASGISVDLKILKNRIGAYIFKDKTEPNVLGKSVRTVPASAIYSIVLYAVPFTRLIQSILKSQYLYITIYLQPTIL